MLGGLGFLFSCFKNAVPHFIKDCGKLGFRVPGVGLRTFFILGTLLYEAFAPDCVGRATASYVQAN